MRALDIRQKARDSYCMTKTQVLEFFGSSVATARVLEITHSAVCQWPEELTRAKADQIRGAMVRLGYYIPAYMRDQIPPPNMTGRRKSAIKKFASLNQK